MSLLFIPRGWRVEARATLQDDSRGGQRRFPVPVRIIILIQTIVITALSAWIFGEYLKNPYLQEYVSRTLQTDMMAELVFLALMAGGFAAGAFTVYMYMKHATPVPLANRQADNIQNGAKRTIPTQGGNLSPDSSLRQSFKTTVTATAKEPVLKLLGQSRSSKK